MRIKQKQNDIFVSSTLKLYEYEKWNSHSQKGSKNPEVIYSPYTNRTESNQKDLLWQTGKNDGFYPVRY